MRTQIQVPSWNVTPFSFDKFDGGADDTFKVEKGSSISKLECASIPLRSTFTFENAAMLTKSGPNALPQSASMRPGSPV